MPNSPAFGQADLTNCERELIHLAGSVQPHGVMLVVNEADWTIVQLSANVAELIGKPLSELLGKPLKLLGGNLDECVRSMAGACSLEDPEPMQAHVSRGDVEGSLHRLAPGVLVVELEPLWFATSDAFTVATGAKELRDHLAVSVERFGKASTVNQLADAAVKAYRELTGHDRVMVYRFDPDGHGKIIAEARDPRLDSLLGHHYPASDIPQRARQLYIRNRVRVLVDVHYEPAPLVPRLFPLSGQDTDMSMCYLRSMSPLHLQYLKNMGVSATLVVSLVHDGQLWGLIAAHHYAPRNMRFAVRAAADLMAEVISTRIAAIENYAHAQVAIQVRRLEQRLVEATSTEGDWRYALFRNPRTLLQPLEATGAALFYEGEILTTGEVPSTPELRALLQWVNDCPHEAPFNCSSVSRSNPELASLTPTASGVLAMRLSRVRPDFLMWFRKEQLSSVTWAGDPTKPHVGDDPLELSPRRSFAAWSEIVRGTALPWTASDIALAKALGLSLADIIVQIHAVRLLIAEHQLGRIRSTMESSHEPVVIASPDGRVLFTNQAFLQLAGPASAECGSLEEVATLFSDPQAVNEMLANTRTAHQPLRKEFSLTRGPGMTLPVSLRAEVVPGTAGAVIGFILIFADLSDNKRAEAARRHLEASLTEAARGSLGWPQRSGASTDADELVNAIFTNVSLAAMDIADSTIGPSVAPLLEQLEQSARRAATLYGHIRSHTEKS
ncbi:GAF domain-containing protein [Hydrogenophaga sp.]|uniref:GAF domain-containing protein n=1 Tax=Hydrogenophaga sp. TaxID=1904254 RepID=UPI002724FA83|nr:GAF domain-containing protein [Hydrogenophaga sp.]MDO8905975.1 GAF domain-containing protein [Hydrogenophaga sp.]